MPTYSDSADITIQSVQESYRQDGRPTIWETLPRMHVKDEMSGVKDTIYRLGKIENTLTNGLLDVRFDEDPPKQQHRDDDPVTISPSYKQTLVTSEPLRADESHRLADMEQNVPIHLNQQNIGYDLLCISKFQDTNAFTSSTFDGTGVLSAFNSDQNPVRDMLDDLRPFRWMQQFTGLDLECYLDSEVATVLAGYEDFQNAMYASTGRQFVSDDDLAASLMRILKVDKVTIISGAYNTAKPGLTQVGARAGSGLLWFGLLDRRGGAELDLTDNTGKGLDGGIAVAQGTRIHMHNWQEPGKQVEYMNARGGFEVLTPRYNASATVTGIFYPSAQIFS